MAVVAAAFLFTPIRAQLRSVAGASALVAVFAAFGVYFIIGSPEVTSRQLSPDVNQMVEGLSSRLKDTPDDVEGWKMLGRSYLTLRRFEEAVEAFRKAVRLEDGQNAQTLVSLGEALLAVSGQQMTAESISLFENALKLQPDNQSALFWGGVAAVNRGDIDEAADRWEVLLGTNPPPEIRQIIEQRVAEWRGTTPEVPMALSVDVLLGDIVPSDLPGNTTVFVIARDPASPSPPIAVTRRQLSELPGMVTLTDADAMIPGRELSRFDRVEVVARIALGGTPVATSGDWFGAALSAPGESVQIEIREQTP